jgi:replicative DNA helicase
MNTATIQRQESASEAERDLVLSLANVPAELPETRDRLRVNDFHTACWMFVYGAMLRLHDLRQPIDAAGIHEQLRQSGELSDVPKDVLIDLAQGVGGTMVASYVDRVLSLSLLRGLTHAVAATVSEIEDQHRSGSPEELLANAQARLDALANRVAGSASVPIDEAVGRAFTDLDARMAGTKRAGVPTGYPQLDDELGGGFQEGHLVIAGARPSVGKTSWALNVSCNICSAGGAVLFVSLEQPEQDLTNRILAKEGKVNGQNIRAGKINQDEVRRLSEAGDAVRPWRWRLQINDRPGQTAAQIATAARRAKRKVQRLDLIVVDYLQLVAPENTRANRNEQVGHTTRRLRDMARELNVPVLLLCQLNRAAEECEVPRLHHLRDSGEIEQHSDLVAFLHRVEPRQPGRADVIDLHIAKQRNGPLGAVRFEHEGSTFTFIEANGIPI